MKWIPLAALLAGCPSSDDPAGDSGTGPTDTVDSDTRTQPDLDGTEGAVQDLLKDFVDQLPGYGDAASRLLDAYYGGSPDGVVLSAPGATRTGTVSVDADLDGTYDVDYDITLTTEGEGGPVQVSANIPYFRSVTSTTINVTMSADDDVAYATNASISVFDSAVTFHGSGGAFTFVADPPAGASAGTMSYIAYTAEPNSIIEGTVDVLARESGGHVYRLSYGPSGGLRSTGTMEEESPGCECGDGACNQGGSPRTLLSVATLLALIVARRRV